MSALPAVYGESVVMRILDKSGLMLGLGELGFQAGATNGSWEILLGKRDGRGAGDGPDGLG